MGAGLTFALLGCAGSAPPAEAPDAAPGKAKLDLSASAASGFAPLTVVLIGRLTGVAADDAAFADPSERWLERLGDNESISEREPGAGRVKPEARPKLFYERTVTLTDPGSYRFQLTIKSSDGRRVSSAWVSVRAILRE